MWPTQSPVNYMVVAREMRQQGTMMSQWVVMTSYRGGLHVQKAG